MQNMEVKTGFGYIRDAAGNVTHKAILPKGSHALKDGYSYIEVEDAAALDLIDVWKDPEVIQTQANEKKIAYKIRAGAISALIGTGDLPAGYE